MRRSRKTAHASLVLRLLLEDTVPASALKALDWKILLRITERSGGTLVRAATRLAALGVSIPPFVQAAVDQEGRRVAEALDLAHHIMDACAALGIEALFPKVVQHYPDLGDDLDLLVVSQAAGVDRAILGGCRTVRLRSLLGSRIAGSTAYRVEGCATPLDIQHGRLGIAGEDETFAAVLWAGRRTVEVADGDVITASPEHLLVLHGMQRVYGRLAIDLADVAYAMASLRRNQLDWTLILETVTRLGVRPGLEAFLAYVEQIHQRVFGRSLVPAPVAAKLRLRGWGKPRFRNGAYRYPLLRVNAALYGRRMLWAIATRQWAIARRLCLVPVIGLDRVLRRVFRAPPPPPAPNVPAGAWAGAAPPPLVPEERRP